MKYIALQSIGVILPGAEVSGLSDDRIQELLAAGAIEEHDAADKRADAADPAKGKLEAEVKKLKAEVAALKKELAAAKKESGEDPKPDDETK